MADTNVGKALKVRPVSDPEVKKLSLSAQISVTKNGVGKMQGFKDKYTDAQIKDMVEYFRTFIK
jgi:mono/diheme cytochrome c family protein